MKLIILLAFPEYVWYYVDFNHTQACYYVVAKRASI